MQLVEQHIIKRTDPRFAIIDTAAFKSKNLYNAALYEMRQTFIFQGKRLSYNQMDKLMQKHEAYKALPAKVAQQVLRQLDEAWANYFKAYQAYQEDPSKFITCPKIPKYKHKMEERNVLVYTLQALSGGQTLYKGPGKGALRQRIIKPSMLPIEVKTQKDPKQIDQVRIVPKKGFYIVEIVYTQEVKQSFVDPTLYAGLDLGMNNLATLASNKLGFVPVVVNGRPVKACNQFYNKRKAQLQKKLGKTGMTKRMERLTIRRNRRIDHYMHAASRKIIDLLVKEQIGTLIIGLNRDWKQEVEMGKRNNQNFVCIPHSRFIQMLEYKAALVGIKVIVREESYTSKASFLDNDPIPKYDPDNKEKPTFSGKRIKRGLYQAKGGRLINADVNGALNILRKEVPDAFVAKGVEDGVVVHPVRITLAKLKHRVVK